MSLEKVLQKQGILFFFLCLFVGIILLYPYHNFQLNLAQGDHGNNLYIFKKVMDGKLPYRDVWWVYGPLMPYYYSFFLRLLEVNIHSVLIGYAILYFFCGLVFYLIIRTFASLYFALLGAAWLWVLGARFEHNYNHAGGFLAIYTTIYALLLYIKTKSIRYLYAGLISIFILSLIKLNIGMVMLVGFVLSISLIDFFERQTFSKDKMKFYLAALGGVPICIGVIYGFFVHGLPMYVIRQCFPILETDQPHHSPVLKSIKILFDHTVTMMTRRHLIGLTVILLFSIGYLFAFPKSQKEKTDLKKELGIILLTLGILFVFNLHEFLVSAVVYRSFWAEPFQLTAIFLIIWTALKNLPKGFKVIVCLALLGMILYSHFARVVLLKPLKHYFSLTRAQIYTFNPRPWVDTVTKVTNYLFEHLHPHETFLALVDDPLYYFLTDRDSPYRQTAFSEHINIHEDQEKELIMALKEKDVRYVLLSNRYKSPELGLGTFGETYCRLLAAYIKSHYQPVAKFGEWEKPPLWIANHGVVILKRNE